MLPLATGHLLTIGVTSYNGEIFFGLNADRDAITDLEVLAQCLTDALEELLDTTDWDQYGRGKDPRCANCMAHCGYEPSAVIATMGSLRESIRAALAG